MYSPFDTENLPDTHGGGSTNGAVIAGHPFGCVTELGSGDPVAEAKLNDVREYTENHTTS